MPRLLFDVAYLEDRIDTAEDEIGLRSLIDARRLPLRANARVFERGFVICADQPAADLLALLLEHQLSLQHPLYESLQILWMLLDDARARREHAVGVVRPVDVDPVGQQHRPLDVVEQRRGVRLDRANEVERAGLNASTASGVLPM